MTAAGLRELGSEGLGGLENVRVGGKDGEGSKSADKQALESQTVDLSKKTDDGELGCYLGLGCELGSGCLSLNPANQL